MNTSKLMNSLEFNKTFRNWFFWRNLDSCRKDFFCSIVILLLFSPAALHAQFIIAGQHSQWDRYYDYSPDADQFVTGWSGSDSISIDLNGDAVLDATLVVHYTGQSMWYHRRVSLVRPQANCEIAYLMTDSCFTADSVPVFISAGHYVSPFTYGVTIDANQVWRNDMLYLSRDYKDVLNPPGGQGTWCVNATVDTTPVYIGVRIFTPDTLYGWIKVSVRSVNGDYTLRVHETACQTSLVGIAENSAAGISVMPNPGTGVFMLNTRGRQGSVTITDLTGRTVCSSPVSGTTTFIDLSAHPSGVYYLRFESEAGEFRQALIISR